MRTRLSEEGRSDNGARGIARVRLTVDYRFAGVAGLAFPPAGAEAARVDQNLIVCCAYDSDRPSNTALTSSVSCLERGRQFGRL